MLEGQTQKKTRTLLSPESLLTCKPAFLGRRFSSFRPHEEAIEEHD